MSVDMNEKIEKRLEELRERAEMLVADRESMVKKIEQTNVELTQIIGAIKELNSMLDK